MRAYVAMIAILAAPFALAAAERSFPAGTFAGTATWEGPGGSSGTYEVERTFEGRALRATFRWDGGSGGSETTSLRFASHPSQPVFDVSDDAGRIVGKGHCYDDACSYWANFGATRVEETFQWSGRRVDVWGAKSGDGFSIVWKERLEAK